MSKLPIRIIAIFIMVLTLALSGCTAMDTVLEPENDSKNSSDSETNNPSRFIMYNQDLTVFDSFFINSGYYYIVDTYTDNVYVQRTSSSHVGIFPLYDENGNITKAKDMGITY